MPRRVHEIFDYAATRAAVDAPELLESYANKLHRFARVYRPVRPAIAISNLLLRRMVQRQIEHSGRVVFLGTRFADLITAVAERRSVLLLPKSPRGLAWGFRHGLVGGLTWEWQHALWEVYRKTGGREVSGRVEAIVRSIQEWLAQASATALVTENDSLFLERAAITAARRCGIPSLTIQHGIFITESLAQIADGPFTDHMLLWGQYFKDRYEKEGIKTRDRLHVLGYPFPNPPLSDAKLSTSRHVCFLGQPWREYDRTAAKAQNEIVVNLASVCRSLGLLLVYRPHPVEHRDYLRSVLPGLRLTPKRESLGTAIERYGTFLSVSSTALIEAGLRGRQIAQVSDHRFGLVALEALGVCPTLANNYQSLFEFLQAHTLQTTSPTRSVIGSNFILQPPNLANAFESILGQI